MYKAWEIQWVLTELSSEQWSPSDNFKYLFPFSNFFFKSLIFFESSKMLSVIFSIVLKPYNPSAVTLFKPSIACWAPGFNAFSICRNVLFDNGLKLNDLQYLLYSFIVWLFDNFKIDLGKSCCYPSEKFINDARNSTKCQAKSKSILLRAKVFAPLKLKLPKVFLHFLACSTLFLVQENPVIICLMV